MRPHAAADGLTDQQRTFVTEYLANGRNASDAYRAAYDAAAMQLQTIRKRASEELQKPAVAAVVAEADRRAAEATERALARYAVTKERLAEELSRLALLDPADIASQPMRGPEDIAKLPEHIRRAIVGWSWDRNGNFVLKLGDKRAAVMDLAKLHGMVSEKVEHSGPNGGAISVATITTNDPAEAAQIYKRLVSGG